MGKDKILKVEGVEITLSHHNDQDYICLTDMAKGRGDDNRAADIIKNWMRNRSTIEFLGAWEQLYNPDFKVVDFHHFRQESGSNHFVLNVKEWTESTGAIGIYAKSGRYGGTYAHKDIAFNFGMWISPVFQLYLVKEYQRLKEVENNSLNLEWNVKRVLSKVNYTLHTDAVKKYVIPASNIAKDKEWIKYAQEADLLNVAVFGETAKHWKEKNASRALKGENLRDSASINELAVLSNIESMNAELIKAEIPKDVRFKQLRRMASEQLTALNDTDFIRSLKYTSEETYPNAIESAKKKPLTDFDKKLKHAIDNPPKKGKTVKLRSAHRWKDIKPRPQDDSED